ncbi:MAG: hypothetical protein IPL79_18265 [Myxococcales bacterium]|nr:hypothetical protein [Myxococcales bacterium]
MSRSVLLIDSDKPFERQLAAELAPLQRVTPCPSARMSSRIAATSPMAVVIAVEEPDKAGFLLCNRAKKGPAAAIPVVMVTKSVAETDFAAHRKLKVHADQYFDKRQLAPGELTASFQALLASAASSGHMGEDFDIVADFTVAPEAPAVPQGDGVVEEPEMIVESGEFEAVDDFDSLIVDHHTKGSRAGASQRSEDDAFAALGMFGGEDLPAMTAAPSPLSDVKTEVAHNTGTAAGLANDFASDFVSGESEFSQEPATNFETDNAVEAVDPQDSLAIPMADAVRTTFPPPVRSATIPPPFKLEPQRAPTQKVSAPAALLFGMEQEYQGGAQALEIEAIPEAVPTPNRLLQSDRFDLGLDEVAAWATEEKSQISDRKALSRVTDLERENERLLAELERARTEAHERNAESARIYLRDQSQELTLRVTQLEQEIAQAKETMASYEASRLAKEGAIAELTAKRTSADAALADATARLMAATTRASDAAAEAERATAQVAQYRTQLDEQAKKHAAATTERDRAVTEAREEYQAALAANAEAHERALAALQEELAAAKLAAQRAMQAPTIATIAPDGAKLARAKKAVAIALTILDEEG